MIRKTFLITILLVFSLFTVYVYGDDLEDSETSYLEIENALATRGFYFC